MKLLRKLFIMTALFLGLFACSSTVEKKNEKWYQKHWCDQMHGQMEVVLKDKTRCDCLLEDYAVEVDFSRKWAESIGQSLHYAMMTGEKAAVLLIMKGPKDERYLQRLKSTIDYHDLPIKVWTTTESDFD